ncbi:twin-arginine translocation signal domain-containing protein [Nitriliruptoraceae bacterium ZYF776]|nr:twin-arginine translocation signal domain-containing protein [Profundirhabdus halotolerans]
MTAAPESTVTTTDAAPSTATDAGPAEPMSVKLVGRLGRALSGKGLSRRRFLGRVAVVGAAVALDPLRYALKPGSAYAQVCGDGASCGQGWTAFCCTVNNGANTCPPGSYAAGWWRIDDSPFCLGSARYVIDCNRSPGSTCSCRCASGSCDQRRVCCNNFRYGQCNTQISGVTEVVCRVVTCMTPWQWDSACNRTSRVDNRTRSHNAPCLPGRDATPIAIKYQDLGLTGSILGRPLAAERQGPGNARYRRYDNGTIYWRSSTGALAIHEPIDQAHRDAGAFNGPLGYPRNEPGTAGGGTGLQVRYDGGTIYHRRGADRAFPVLGGMDTRYRNDGGPGGSLGYPTSVASRADGSHRVRFQDTSLLVQVVGRPVVAQGDDVRGAAEHAATSSPDHVGWAIAEETRPNGARLQRHEAGIVVQRAGGALTAVGADLADRYLELGGPASIGRPAAAPRSVASGRGRALELADGGLYTSPATGTRYLTGDVHRAYVANGGPNGALGLPTSDRVVVGNGQVRASFENGAIVIEPNGSVSVLRSRSTRAPSGLDRTSPDGTRRRPQRDPSELTP